MRGRLGVNVHLLRIVSEHGLDAGHCGGGAERSTSGGEGRSNVLDGGTVGSMKFADYILPSHVMVAGVASNPSSPAVTTGAKLPDEGSALS